MIRPLHFGVLSLALLSTAIAPAQGLTDHVNFEAPQVKPIALATIGAQTFLFACNTADNSIEAYEVTGGNRDAPLPLLRIPVGNQPVSVVYHSFANPTTRMLYAVNWLSDSVTIIQLAVTGGVLSYEIKSEVTVTSPRDTQAPPLVLPGFSSPLLRGDDQPMHLAVFDRTIGGNVVRSLVVSKRVGSSYALIDPFTGAPQNAFDPTGVNAAGNGANVIMTNDPASTNNGQFPVGATLANHPVFSNATFKALKEPHTVIVRPLANEFWVLATQGGGSKVAHSHSSPVFPAYTAFDFDIWGVANPTTAAPTFRAISGLGTTNFNMSFSSDGRYLYVVSTDAQNHLVGNVLLSSAPTGFVKTLLHQIDFNNNWSVATRDLNTQLGGVTPVGASASLAHATDVQVYRRPAFMQGKTAMPAKDYVCVVGFNSDRFAVVDTVNLANNPLSPGSWGISGVPVETNGVHDANNIAGPRGIAVWETGSVANDRVYILNRLDNSITIVDPKGGQGAPIWKNKQPLMHEARPAQVLAGQKLLYSTDFSGNRFVSCASCHVDTRSDQLPWRLSMPPPAPLALHAIPPLLPNPRDGLENASESDIDELPGGVGAPPEFPYQAKPPNPDPLANGKGPMVTQSLQGLVNFEVGGNLFEDANPADNDEDFSRNDFDDLITNAPYHWRGDKDNFMHFNEAFVALQGKAPFITTDRPSGGVSTADMKAYETFVNTIHYPPNALQPKNRVYAGDVPTNFDSVAVGNGTGARRGLMLFHTLPIGSGLFAGRSCVECHTLPAGSNNRISCLEHNVDLSSDPGTLFIQPLESTAMRGMVQKHAILELAAATVSPVSIAALLPQWRSGDGGMGHEGIARGRTPGEFIFPTSLGAQDKTDINDYMRQFDQGIAPMVGRTFLVDLSNNGSIPGAVTEMEAEAKKADCGIAVYARLANGPGFIEKGFWYRFDPLNNVEPGYQEVGSAAAPVATLTLIQSMGLPGERMIFRATPLGSERRVAALNGIGGSAGSLVATSIQIVGTKPNSANVDVPNMLKNWDPLAPAGLNFIWSGTHRTPLSLQVVRTFQAALNPIGVLVRHDASRRLQVTGDNIQQGARMRLTLPNGNKTVEMPIFPTMTFFGGKRVFETAVEFAPIALYTLMLGGPADSEVQKVMQGLPASLAIQSVDVSVSNTPDVPASWTSPTPSPIPYLPL